MNLEPELLRALLEAPENRLTVTELVNRLKTDQSLVMAAAVKLKESGLVEIIEHTFEELIPGPQWSGKLPERSALERLTNESAVELSRLPVI
ncbi:MAG: helix-turn-helix domain-containing protein, partial [candidate division WOR-3 bacterium]